MHETNEKKIISIPLFMIVLFVMIITILVLSVKAICFSNNSESEENVIPAKIEEEKEIEEEKDIEEINTQEVESEEEQKEEAPAQSTEKVKSYTSSNEKTYDSIGILNIPSLNIEYPILSTTSEKNLKVSLTKYWGGNPNEVGNLCVSGHNYKNSKFFGKLQNIKNGDII